MTMTYERVTSAEGVRENMDKAGSFFFSPNTMRFWKSKLLTGYWEVQDKKEGELDAGYFVTSDVWGEFGRLYSARKYVQTVDGVDIEPDETYRYRTANEAKRAARLLAAGETPPAEVDW